MKLLKIGTGGFAKCYQLEDNCVLKMFDKNNNKFSQHLFNMELEMYKKIDNKSKYIINYYDYFLGQNKAFFKLERCDVDLFTYQKFIKVHAGQLYEMITQMLYALQTLQENKIIHCDIKPSNILMKYDENRGRNIFKLCDFGLAQFIDHNFTGTKGTSIYIDPLTLQGYPFSYKSDLWSLGISVLKIILPKNQLNFLSYKQKQLSIEQVTYNLQSLISNIQDPVVIQFLTMSLLKRDFECYDILNILMQMFPNLTKISQFYKKKPIPHRLDQYRLQKDQQIFKFQNFGTLIKLKAQYFFIQNDFIITDIDENSFEQQYYSQVKKIVNSIGISGKFTIQIGQPPIISVKKKKDGKYLQLTMLYHNKSYQYNICINSNDIVAMSDQNDLALIQKNNLSLICPKNQLDQQQFLL